MDSARSASSSFGTKLTRFLRFYFGPLLVCFWNTFLFHFGKNKKHCEQRGRCVNPGTIKFDDHLRRHKSQLREVEGARGGRLGKNG